MFPTGFNTFQTREQQKQKRGLF